MPVRRTLGTQALSCEDPQSVHLSETREDHQPAHVGETVRLSEDPRGAARGELRLQGVEAAVHVLAAPRDELDGEGQPAHPLESQRLEE